MAPSHPIQKLISLDSPAEWRSALQGVPHSFAHTWENCYAMHLTTKYPTFLYTCELNGTRIVCPLAERRCGQHKEAVTPYGFSGFTGTGDIADFPTIWRDFARSRDWITAFITLSPLFHRPGFTDPNLVQQYNTLFFLDLTLSETELLQRLDQSRRRGLRRWEASGVSIITNREQLTHFLLENHREFFRQKGASQTCHFTEATLSFLSALEGMYIVGASIGGQLQSVHMSAFTEFSAEALFSVSLPEGRQHSAGLLWNTVRHLQNHRIPMLNLGGGVRPDDGLAEFKRRFGAIPMPLRALRQFLQPSIYNELCEHAGVIGTELSGFFPPYHILNCTGR